MNPYIQTALVFLTSWFVASLIVLFSLFRARRILTETIESMRDARERDQARRRIGRGLSERRASEANQF